MTNPEGNIGWIGDDSWGMTGRIPVWACEECGALVLDKENHAEWHAGLRAIGQVAHDADRVASMFRPLR